MIKILIMNLIVHLTLLFLSITFTANVLKPLIGDCQSVWNIDRYTKTDFFCATEDSRIDQSLDRMEKRRKK